LKIPKKVTAFGRTYVIHRDNNAANIKQCWGFFDPIADTIILREHDCDLTSGRERQVFVHEIIHLLDDNLQIKLNEKQTQLLAVGLSTIISENGLDFRDGK
jgi:hypothetical protein